jgi:putative FmdB family regulatory protein
VPLYEYQCLDCEERFEKIQKFSDPPIAKCPACGGGKITQLLSAPAVQFKGSGWYVTDYARKAGSGNGKSSSGGGTAEGSANAEKSDTKKADSAPAKKAAGPSKSGGSKQE